MRDVQREFGLAYVVISHDLSVVKYLADRIGVMYLGKPVEIGPAEQVYGRPIHPYTSGLLSAIPVPDPASERKKGKEDAVAGEAALGASPAVGLPLPDALSASHRPPCDRGAATAGLRRQPPRLGACHLTLREPAATAVPSAEPQVQP
jgi:hypothetical protein